jgi:cytochrome P450
VTPPRPGSRNQDWDPRSDAVLRDQCAAYDEMRRRCPVAYSDFLGWSLFRHEDVLRVVEDHQTFSNVVSTHRSVPNGTDPPEHTDYRSATDPYFAPERLEAFEPVFRRIASRLLRSVPLHQPFDFIKGFALLFASEAQCAFLGWPSELAEPIRAWTNKNHEATLAGDRRVMADIARQFTAFVEELLEARRRAGADAEHDVTASLMRTHVNGTPLTDGEIVSVLRNWTVGEVGSISSALGILAHHLAVHRGLQQRLRAQSSLLPPAIDEILRICGPLVASRRTATRDVEIRGRHIAAGERITLMWVSANRDERVFEQPEEVRLDRDPELSLLYGKGIHVCPGAPLARLELRVVLEELFRHADRVELDPTRPPQMDVYPQNGFASLYVALAQNVIP